MQHRGEMDGAVLTDRLFTVTQLAEALGVSARTIRFYEDKGLILPQRAGTTRIYTHRDRARMVLILRGKRLGFTLREIKDYLDLYEVDHTQKEQLRVLVKAVGSRIERLEQQRVALDETLGELREIKRQADDAVARVKPAAGKRRA